ncbi:MAG: hypothetical protein ACLRZ9_11665 [Eubacterium sp.]
MSKVQTKVSKNAVKVSIPQLGKNENMLMCKENAKKEMTCANNPLR